MVKKIFVPISKEEMNSWLNDISYEMQGDKLILSNSDFNVLWRSNIIEKFDKSTDVFIDDYETTVVEDISDLILLKEILENISVLHYKSFRIAKKILLLVDRAIEKRSGIIFFF